MTNVGLDGSFLRRGPSGIRTYVEHLTSIQSQFPPDVELQVLEPPRHGISTWLPGKFEMAAWDLLEAQRQARSMRADLMHIPHLAMPLRKQLPLIVTVHDVIPFTWAAYRQSKSMKLLLRHLRRTMRLADLVIVPSSFVASGAVDVLDIDPVQIRVIPMAAEVPANVESERDVDEQILAGLGLRSGKYVFNVAGFDLRKNLPTLVRAFALLDAEIDRDWKLVIAGAPHTGNQVIYPTLVPLIEELGMRDQVVLTGRIDEQTKWCLYQGARLYATPSLDEGFGMTAVEAMACGVPTVVSDRGSLPEVVGDAALITEPNPHAFAEAMRSLMFDESSWNCYRGKGFDRAAIYTWTRTLAATMDVYRELG